MHPSTPVKDNVNMTNGADCRPSSKVATNPTQDAGINKYLPFMEYSDNDDGERLPSVSPAPNQEHVYEETEMAATEISCQIELSTVDT